MVNLKKIQMLRWEKRISCSGSAVTYKRVRRRGPGNCFEGSYGLRQLIWRFKSQWKQALRWQRNTAQYAYDPQSYSQNFDDGGLEYFASKKESEVNGSSLKDFCGSWRINVELNNIRGFSVVPQECTEYIGKYITSTQYKEDLERAVEECAVYLSSCCKVKGDGRDAWIFDIDVVNCALLQGWMRGCKAPALDQALKLFHEIKDKGIKIFSISSRREDLRDATVDNLIKVGFYGWSGLLRLYFEDMGLDDEYKEVHEGYKLWGIVGDQWTSFDGHPIAKRSFKLPNSLFRVS